jgi:hypothetical protein
LFISHDCSSQDPVRFLFAGTVLVILHDGARKVGQLGLLFANVDNFVQLYRLNPVEERPCGRPHAIWERFVLSG